MNFGAVPATVPCDGDARRLVLATHPGATELRPGDATVELPGLAGALVSSR